MKSERERTHLGRIFVHLFLIWLLVVAPIQAQGPGSPPSRSNADRRGASSFVVPPGPPPEARLEQDHVFGDTGDAPGSEPAARNRLVLPNGRTFHRTAEPVENLRTVQVPGSSIQLYLWEEGEAGGPRQSYYAVSQTGTKLRGRVRATTYEVRLRDYRFDPLVDGPPLPPQALSARSGSEVFLVQFVTTPLPEFREAIEAFGGKVLRFLSDHTYIVRMDRGAQARIVHLPYVRWIGEYHPTYRVEKTLREALVGSAPALAAQRYSIQLGERGKEQQEALASLVEALGGTVELIEPGGLRVEATLTQEQLLELVQDDNVHFVDRWGGPGEPDMNNVRTVGGANYVESVGGYTGAGVSGEVFDTELRTTHQEWGATPMIHSAGVPTSCSSYHGTSCYSNNFATGVDADARGMVPDGQGIFFCYAESTQFGGTKSRYDINAELINPAGPYRAVFQTSSVGSSRTLDYTTISAEVDDYLFQYQLLSTQSQSNAGNQMSRPQAWAKNIVSVGALRHLNDADRCNDYWGFGASIGPADDGRIKPDLSGYYDSIHSAYASSDTAYTEFGGTSSATPQTSGHFGLLFQMWHEGVWAGHGGGADVFDSRPHMSTAKALMINNAYRYDWTNPGACSYSDADRFKQGWGMPDLQRLYDRAPVTDIIDETDTIAPLGVNSYTVSVATGESELNVTMVYTDPAGTVGAAQDRVNDLSLKVTSPTGTVYWGNNGLTAGNTSTSGGVSNTVDTVENVFLRSPTAGTWTVEVFGDEIVQDAHLETSTIDADYALVVSGGSIVPIEGSLPLPNFQTTYAYPSHTRGYWFVAPTNFVITGLQVPDETGHGLQNVEVVRLNVTPPSTPGTNNFTSLFRQVAVSSATVINTQITVNAGDIIGILGAAGDTTTMYNSYGNVYPYTSEILGQPVTLTRLATQVNLAATPATQLWSNNYYIARVRMFYSAFNEVSVPPYSRTFSASTLTRGLWFTAPRDFTITGLQVPDEAAHGLQNIEFVLFGHGATPPLWPSTTNNFASILRVTGVSSSQIVEVSIPVQAGQTIGILGAAGDASIMHNSYGTAYTWASDIFGSPMTINRLGMQYNLVTTPAQNLWTENGNAIGRVRILYDN